MRLTNGPLSGAVRRIDPARIGKLSRYFAQSAFVLHVYNTSSGTRRPFDYPNGLLTPATLDVK